MFNWKRELFYLGAIFVLLAGAMHFGAWVDHPVAQIEALPQSSLGPWHPLYLTLAVYLVVAVIRLAAAALRKLFTKR